MAPSKSAGASRTAPGLEWKRHAVRPSKGTDIANPGLAAALASGKNTFTREELDAFKIEDLDWKSIVTVEMGGETKYFQPNRPPKPDHPVLVAFVGIFVLMSIYGFFWMCWTMAMRSYEFYAEIDVRTPSGAVTTVGSALFGAVVLYYVFYPEGQLAKDAVAQRGAGRKTFAYGTERH